MGFKRCLFYILTNYTINSTQWAIKIQLWKNSNGENRHLTFSPTLLQYVQNKCKSKFHFFCIPVLLLFYKLLLLICYDILAIENYLQCREDDGGQGEQKSLAGLVLAAFKYAQEIYFYFLRAKEYLFQSIRKYGLYCNLCKLCIWREHTWLPVRLDQFWQIQTIQLHLSGCNAPNEVCGHPLDWPRVFSVVGLFGFFFFLT